jgi:hypothetical protein
MKTRIDMYHNIDITWKKYIKGIKYIAIFYGGKFKWNKIDQMLQDDEVLSFYYAR